jgi:hypothetical protein
VVKQEEKETLETLWGYCASNSRVCPMPMKWNDLFNTLKGHENLNLPLILNGWEMSSSLEKHMRFEEHIKFAATHDQLDEVGKYLRTLSEEDWAHYGEI